MIDKQKLKQIGRKCTLIRKHPERKTVGFVASAFDLFHCGHALMVKSAKEHCDYLIAAVHIDPSVERPSKNKPIMTLKERIILVEGSKYIDDYIIYETEEDLLHILIEIHPSIRFLGEDWKDKDYTGKGKFLNTPIHWIDRSHNYSTTELRRRIYEAEKIKESLSYHDVEEFYKD